MSWWIARAHHTLSHDVAATPERVRAFYADLDNLTRVHPLVVSVQAQARRELADGYQQDYRVRDRIPLGPCTLPISYAARLTVPSTGDVCAAARQFPRVRLDSRVGFHPAKPGTRITEELTISAPRPLLTVTVSQAVKAHTAMLAAMGRLLES
ncbi:SRPBCC family protein [Mycolicibacterium sp. XJ870]